MYLHPAHVSDRLMAKWAQARVVPYLDMPVQHGDDAVLRAMRRAITARRMKDVIARFRDAIPGLTVRTTVLVGFPGETEAAFDNLLAFVEDVAFDRLGVFTYSVEEGTPAAAMAGPGARGGDGRARRPRPGDAGPLAWPRQKALYGSRQTVLVDGPSADPRFPSRAGSPARPRRSTGSCCCATAASRRGASPSVRIVEVEGYELVGE